MARNRCRRPSKANDPRVRETQALIAEGMAGRSTPELARLLGHSDMRIRQEAQFGLAALGSEAIAPFAAAAQAGSTLVARLHGIWGLGQVARKSPDALNGVVPLLADQELEVRCQAAKVIGDGRTPAAYEPLAKMLADPEPRAPFFAAQALGKLGRLEALPALFHVLQENNAQDALLPYPCVTALAKLSSPTELTARANDQSEPSARRGAGAAAAGSSGLATFLNDADGQVVLEAARAINDLPIPRRCPNGRAAEQDAAAVRIQGGKAAGYGARPATHRRTVRLIL